MGFGTKLKIDRNLFISKLSDNNSIHVIYKQSKNTGKYAVTLETAMLAQGVC